MTTARVLVLGGLDPCGGAGITADARVLEHHGVLGLPVALALTVQNRFSFTRMAAVAPDLWQDALAAALADGEVHAAKIGLLADPQQLGALGQVLAPLAHRIPIVVDPVLSATAGGLRTGGEMAAAYRQHLLPLAAVLTPNLPELAALAPRGGSAELLHLGCGAVLIKGGHADADPVRDVLHTARGERVFPHARLPVGPVHGTGCAFASALAAQLANGVELELAVASAVEFLHACLERMGPPDASGRPRPLALPTRTAPR